MTNDTAKALAIVAVGRIVTKEAKTEIERKAQQQVFLSDNECEQLILNMLEGRSDAQGATDEELSLMLNEVAVLRYQIDSVNLAIKGLITLDVDPNEPRGSRLIFKRRQSIDSSLREVLKAQHNATATATA